MITKVRIDEIRNEVEVDYQYFFFLVVRSFYSICNI